jgi:hypothetical protein
MPPITKKMMDKISEIEDQGKPSKKHSSRKISGGLQAFKIQKSSEEWKNSDNPSQYMKRL